MKNVFFALAFMLMGTFAFANNNEKSENFSYSNLETVAVENLSTATYTLNINENQLSHSEFLALEDCTIKYKITVTSPDGTKKTYEGSVTIVGQSCAELIKGLMK